MHPADEDNDEHGDKPLDHHDRNVGQDGDFGSGRIWSLEYDGTQVVSNREIANVASLTSFGEDNSGELYAVSGNGDIFRFSESE